MSSSGEREVVVLHAFQQIGRGLGAAFAGSGARVRVMTTAPPSAVFRLDAGRGPIEVAEATGAWRSDALPGLLRDPAVELVTNDESCLEECARLRAAAGRDAMPVDQVRAYVDKVEMKTRLRAAGVGVPRFALLDPGGDAAEQIVAAIGLPAVVKPRRGAYNVGVQALASEDEARAWAAEHRGEEGWQAESFAAGRLCHANAVVADGTIVPLVVGAYTDPPLGLMRGGALGSVGLPPGHPLHTLGVDVCRRTVEALGTAGRFVVHAEFFVDGDEVAVIDVAPRAPGALVSDAALVATGVHLEEASYRLQAGGEIPEPRDTGLAAGWLWCPGAGARTALVSWSPDFEQLVADLERAGGGGAGWLAALRRAGS